MNAMQEIQCQKFNDKISMTENTLSEITWRKSFVRNPITEHLAKRHSWQAHVVIQSENTHVEDFKTSNIQYTNEMLTLLLGIQSLVTLLDQPFEETIEDTLAQSTNGVGDLLDVTALGDELVTDLDAGLEQVLVQLSGVAAEQLRHTATLLLTILFSLLLATTLLELHATHMHDSGGDLVHILLLLLGEAQDVESLLYMPGRL